MLLQCRHAFQIRWTSMALQILIEQLFHSLCIDTNGTVGLKIVDDISGIEKVARCKRVPMFFLQDEIVSLIALEKKYSYRFQTVWDKILTDDMHMKKRHRRDCMISIPKVSKWTISTRFRCRSATDHENEKSRRREWKIITYFSATSLPTFSICFSRGRCVLFVDFRSAMNSLGMTSKWMRA